MLNSPAQPEVIDPDNIPEILCDGQFNVRIIGQFVTLTFTHVRPEPTALFKGDVFPKAVVRARIVTTIDNLEALRDLLNSMTRNPNVPSPPASGGVGH
jgi:hypothetical protein